MKTNNKVINYFKQKTIIEYLVVTILFVLASIYFAHKAGLLYCGMHFTDDYEILDINRLLKTNGLFSTIKYYVVGDLIYRFRPLYFVVRIIRTAILGDNYFNWHLLLAIETGLYVSASYILARKLKTPLIPSIIFAFIYLIGSQDEIAWRLGPQESMALLYLVLSFLFIVLYYDKKEKKYGVLATLNIIFMILYKESFLILAPAVVLFLFYLEIKDNKQNEDINIFKQLWQFIVNHKIMIITIIVTLLISAMIILTYTGLFSIGYAGIDSTYSFKDYIHLTLNVFIRDLKEYWLVFVLMAVLFVYAIVIKVIKKETTKQYLRFLFVGLVFSGYSLVCQAILYGASAMFTRYYIPCVWLIYFIFIVMEGKILKPLVSSILMIFIMINSINIYEKKEHSVYMDGLCYADEGENIMEMLDYTASLIADDNEAKILTEFSWYEQSYAVSVYLQNKTESKTIYNKDEDRDDGDYKNIYKDDGSRISLDEATIIMTELGDDYSSENYTKTNFDGYTVAVKK